MDQIGFPICKGGDGAITRLRACFCWVATVQPHAASSSIPTDKDYENAIKFYSQAIELNPSNAIYYGNRSLAYLRTECYGYALADATRAIEIDKKYIKGYYRRAASNMALGKFRAALRDYETVSRASGWMATACGWAGEGRPRAHAWSEGGGRRSLTKLSGTHSCKCR